MLININGIRIDYRDQGAGVPVIFIHAFPLNQTMWDDQLAVLRYGEVAYRGTPEGLVHEHSSDAGDLEQALAPLYEGAAR